MSEQPTPGPYRIGKPGGPSGPFWSVVNQDGQIVALQIPSEANAHRIAAVPDLYEALAFAKSCLLSGEPWDETCEQMIDGALKKARGEE